MATNPTICVRIGEITQGALCVHVYPRDDGQSEIRLQGELADSIIVRVGDNWDSPTLTVGDLRALATAHADANADAIRHGREILQERADRRALGLDEA